MCFECGELDDQAHPPPTLSLWNLSRLLLGWRLRWPLCGVLDLGDEAMTMTAEEAKKIVETNRHLDRLINDKNVRDPMYQTFHAYIEADGFLQAWAVAEKLAEKLGFLKLELYSHDDYEGTCALNCRRCCVEEALSLYDQARGPSEKSNPSDKKGE